MSAKPFTPVQFRAWPPEFRSQRPPSPTRGNGSHAEWTDARGVWRSEIGRLDPNFIHRREIVPLLSEDRRNLRGVFALHRRLNG